MLDIYPGSVCNAQDRMESKRRVIRVPSGDRFGLIVDQ